MSEAIGGLLRDSLIIPLPGDDSERAALDAVLEQLAPVFERVPVIDGERAGALLLVTDDAGTGTAVQFWRDALATGLALASPGNFPWCLANAPCATIARRFGITGANITWLAKLSDPAHAFDGPAAWLADHFSLARANGAATDAWVAAVHFGTPGGRIAVWHWEGVGPSPDEPEATAGLVAAMRDRMAREWSVGSASRVASCVAEPSGRETPAARRPAALHGAVSSARVTLNR